MKIWVDGDACPQDVKEILFKTARRLNISMIIVANQIMRFPASDLIQFQLVAAGANVADRYIVDHVATGDLVITADIPLAGDAIPKGAIVLDHRGEVLDAENIGARLAARNLMDELRGTGLETGGPAPYNSKNKQAFANQLDRLLVRMMRDARQ